MAVVYCNGNFINTETPAIPITHRAFQYGDGFFESMRTKDGQLQYSTYHIDRIKESLLFFNLSHPEIGNLYFLHDLITSLCHKNRLLDARIKLFIVRSHGGKYIPNTTVAELYAIAEPISDIDIPSSVELHICTTYKRLSAEIYPLSNYKSISCASYIQSALAIKKAGWTDAIFCNEKDNIVETLSSNIFFQKENTIMTPPLSDGCLNGVMRRVMIDKLKNEGNTLYEKSISMTEIDSFSSAFISNAVLGIIPITKIGDLQFTPKVSMQ